VSRIGDHKNIIQKEVDNLSRMLIDLSDTIHGNPELGLKEFKAVELLTSKIESLGFQVEKGVAGLNTAFIATYRSKKPGPKIAFLAEYDCVPGLGHACGHNIIAASSFGAAAVMKKAVDQFGGTVALYGTPDEEAVDAVSKGGKVIMAEAGLFNDVDAALMMHPIAGPNIVWRYTFPLRDFSVRYLGKSAHYTEPQKGVNALESLLMFLHDVNTMKRGWRQDVMFAYTITDGGGPSALTVPASAEAHITMKAFHAEYLSELYEKVERCARNVASNMDAELEMKVISEYKNMIPNLNLTKGIYNNLRQLRAEVEDPCVSQRNLERLRYPGISTDFADVSWVTPGIHAYCSIGERNLVAHTPEFADAACSAQGHRAVILASKALAMTGLDILAKRDYLENIRMEFQRYKAESFTNVPGIPPEYHVFPKEFVQEL
jgi:amidohydrolase